MMWEAPGVGAQKPLWSFKALALAPVGGTAGKSPLPLQPSQQTGGDGAAQQTQSSLSPVCFDRDWLLEGLGRL